MYLCNGRALNVAHLSLN